MTTPAPSQVAADAVAVAMRAGEVARAYAWLHDSGFGRESARDRVGSGRTTVVDEDGTVMPPTPDPAGETAIGQRRRRDKLAFAARCVARARAQLDGAEAALAELAELVDEQAGHEPEERDRRVPRVATKAEISAARAAQRRRIARGEGLGAEKVA